MLFLQGGEHLADPAAEREAQQRGAWDQLPEQRALGAPAGTGRLARIQVS